MAFINLIPNQRKLHPVYTSKRNNKIHKTVYNTDHWRKLRINYLAFHPVCERCNNALAIDVHHKTAISTATNEAEMKRIGFDETNLMSLCRNCHKLIHHQF